MLHLESQLLQLLLPLIPWWFDELMWPFWEVGHVEVGLMKVGSIISIHSHHKQVLISISRVKKKKKIEN